jgi:hypothetical protein
MGQHGSGGMEVGAMDGCLAPITNAAQWHAVPSNAIVQFHAAQSYDFIIPNATKDMALVAYISQRGRKPGVNIHGRQCHTITCRHVQWHT